MLTKIAFPMDENDRWFEQAHGYVEELEEMLTRLQTSVDSLVSYRCVGGRLAPPPQGRLQTRTRRLDRLPVEGALDGLQL